MALERVLIDSSYLFALYDQDSKRHAEAIKFSRNKVFIAIVPMVTLTEVAFLARRKGGIPAFLSFSENFRRGKFQLEPVTLDDLKRVEEIAYQYASAELDFVDCCIMALSERLNITQICTFDRRDFSIFRPKHCDYLELLP